jgi:hypothetical protein
MIAAVMGVVVPFFIGVGFVDEAVIPAGKYLYNEATQLDFSFTKEDA